ncbi:MAG: hypothetical protein AAFN50_10140 [Pseudomonadota bacterium]
MNASYDKKGAIVVLPPVTGGRLTDKKLRAWLAQSELSRNDQPQELLARVLSELGFDYPEEGLGAMRMWGQTSERPTGWIAAADPVYLEPQMDYLCLHALRRTGVPASEMRTVVDHLQTTLGYDKSVGFIRLGSYGYVSSQKPFATSHVPAYVVDQQEPGEYLPSGEETALHRNVLSEIEMALHEHPINLERIEAGKQPINSLWLWGGGMAPEAKAKPQPPLYSEDALLTGYWYTGKGVAEPWPGSIAECLEQSVAGFVAETPEFADDTALLESLLNELREALRDKRLDSLVLLFRDGVRAEVHRSHGMRVWRRDSSVLA